MIGYEIATGNGRIVCLIQNE